MSTPTISDICLHFLGYSHLNPDQQQAQRESWGFKGKCVRILSKLLGVSTSRVWHWGKGLDFPKIPQRQLDKLTIIYLQDCLAQQKQVNREQQKLIARLRCQPVRVAS